jgi:hypothetical protein
MDRTNISSKPNRGVPKPFNVYYKILIGGTFIKDCRLILISTFIPMARQPLGGLGLLIFRGFTITHFGHTILGRTPLDE